MMVPCDAPEENPQISILKAGRGWGVGSQFVTVAAAGTSSSGFASTPHPAPGKGQRGWDFLLGSNDFLFLWHLRSANEFCWEIQGKSERVLLACLLKPLCRLLLIRAVLQSL